MGIADSTKRKLPLGRLQRRVRARKEEEPEPDSGQVFSDGPEDAESGSEEESSEGESDDGGEINESTSNSSDEDEDEDSEGAEEDDPSSVATASQISFGALAKAQATLPSARDKKNRSRKGTQNDDEDGDGDGDENRNENRRSPYAPSTSKPKIPKPHRSSKHAPTEITSKRQVTRKREVVSYAKVAPRDPRFSSAVSAKGKGADADEERARRAYSFLDEYRETEVARLREALKKTRDVGAKEELKRAIASMQSRRQAQERKDAERALVAGHRRHERDLVAQGKKPFYLKKSEQRKMLLVDRFAGMKKKEVDRTIERRRKKITARERRDMPFTRREAQ